ncbi:Golgi apparatus membrane protein TVP15 [Cryptosporidium meleagridis]
MSKKSSSESRKTTFKIFILQLLWIGFFIILILGGLSDLILFYDIKRMVLNVFIILSGIISLLAEAYCFKFYSYILFIYTPIGRGLFMATLSCLNLNENLYSLIISSILFLNSLIYLLISVIFGGINKPLFNNSLKHELNLRAQVYFINNHSNNRKKHIHNGSTLSDKSESYYHNSNNNHNHHHHHRSHHKHHDNGREDYHQNSKHKSSNHKSHTKYKSSNNHQEQKEIINLD